MIQNNFRRFRPANDQPLNSGVATLHPPPKSSVTDTRDPLQSVRLPVINHTGLRPKPPPTRIPFKSVATRDGWNQTWSQCVARHTGVLPPLPQKEKPEMALKRYFGFKDPEQQTVQQYVAGVRGRAGRELFDLQLKETSERNERRKNDRKEMALKYQENVRKRMENHVFLVSSMQSARASIQTAEAEVRSVTFAIRDKEREFQKLKCGIEDHEIEIKMLQERYKRIDEYTGILEYAPPELWENILKSLEDTVIELKGFDKLEEVDLVYIELCLHQDRGNMLLLKSIREKMYILSEVLKALARTIMSLKEEMERQKLEIDIVWQKLDEDKKLLKSVNGQVKSLKDSFTALRKKDRDLVQVITRPG